MAKPHSTPKPSSHPGPGPHDVDPPIGGCKVKIKDGNGTFLNVTYSATSGFGVSSTSAYTFNHESPVTGESRFQIEATGWYMASGGPRAGVIASNHRIPPTWIWEGEAPNKKLRIATNADEYLAIDATGALVINGIGSSVELEQE